MRRCTGYYQDETGQQQPKPCEIGKYQNQSGQDSCLDCAVGKFQNSIGNSSCIDCPNGKYQDRTGQGRCNDTACSSNQISLDITSPDCTTCPYIVLNSDGTEFGTYNCSWNLADTSISQQYDAALTTPQFGDHFQLKTDSQCAAITSTPSVDCYTLDQTQCESHSDCLYYPSIINQYTYRNGAVVKWYGNIYPIWVAMILEQ